MHELTLWDMVIRLVLSVVFGALIGMERETHGRPAGLRTHILVCFGSTLFTLSSYQIAGTLYDPARVTAQIVTGVGFLGAGTIIHQGNVIRGLTTAASIWTVAAIGVAVAVGGNMLFLAGIASLLVFIVLSVMPRVERLLTTRQDERSLTFTSSPGHEGICNILSILSSHNIRVRMLSREESVDGNTQVISMRLRVPTPFDDDSLSNDLAACKDVSSYGWD